MKTEGVIFDVDTFAVHDGPGIRMAVYFKGCPLSCKWCHSPESRKAEPELIFMQDRCELCGTCADVCPVRIPIPDLLLHWRERAADAGLTPLLETFGSRFYAGLAERPAAFRAAGGALRTVPWLPFGRALPVIGAWTQEREAPRPSPKSFRQLWREGIE